jgi:hypothetical protein
MMGALWRFGALLSEQRIGQLVSAWKSGNFAGKLVFNP